MFLKFFMTTILFSLKKYFFELLLSAVEFVSRRVFVNIKSFQANFEVFLWFLGNFYFFRICFLLACNAIFVVSQVMRSPASILCFIGFMG